MRLPIGVVAVVYGGVGVETAAQRAADQGFEHLDCSADAVAALGAEGVGKLPLSIGDLISGMEVRPGCTAMALVERRGEDRFQEAVDLFSRNPGARLEPGPRSMASS